MTLSPAPVDPTNRRAWVRWADELRRFVTTAGQFGWSQVDKTGSSLADLATRSHTDLTSIGTNTHAQIDTHVSAANPHSGSASTNTGTTATAGLQKQVAAVTDLSQTISATYSQAEVQAISDKVDELLAAQRLAGTLET